VFVTSVIYTVIQMNKEMTVFKTIVPPIKLLIRKDFVRHVIIVIQTYMAYLASLILALKKSFFKKMEPVYHVFHLTI
jgi:hypothetical protein